MPFDDKLIPHIAHDFQNPLTSIQGYTQMILMTQGDQLPADVRRNLDTVLVSCGQLRRMILTVSYVSQLQSGGYELQAAETSGGELASRAMGAMVEYAEMQKKKLDFEKGVSPAPALKADASLLELALQNAIANAIARVRSGCVVRIRAVERSDGGVEIAIEDAGPMIPPEFRDAMFDPRQVDRIKEAGLKTDRALGLALFKLAAELHGGSVGIESSETNTRIWMKLPSKLSVISRQ